MGEARSRRALLGAGLGGIVAMAAAALGRPVRVQGADDGPVVIGNDNFGESKTSLHGVIDSEPTLNVANDSETTGGVGVRGTNYIGTAVHGRTNSGAALVGEATFATGFALRADGRVSLHTSGVATIPAGQTVITVEPADPPVIVTNQQSVVLLTPRTDIGTRHLWYSSPAVSVGYFQIHMSGPRNKPTKVAWVLLG